MYWVIKWCFEWWLISFISCLASLLKYCHKLWIERQIVVRWKHVSFFCMENTWKRIFYSSSTLILQWIKLEKFVTQLKRQSIEVWQNEKRYSKGNNTSENPLPRQEIFKPVDHGKYEGEVRSQHLLLVQFSRWAFKLPCYLRKLL